MQPLERIVLFSLFLSVGITAAAQTPTPSQQPSPSAQPPAAQSQEREKPAISPDQDLSLVPMLTWDRRAIPPAPSTARLGVTNGAPLVMSLNDAIRRALENNKNIEVARDNVRLNEMNLNTLEGVYDPVFQFTPLVNHTVAPQVSSPSGVSLSRTVSQTDFLVMPSMTKQFSTGGGQYQVFFDGLRRTTDSPFTLLSPLYSSNLGMTFVQPLMRNRSVDVYRHNIRVQRKRLSQSDAEFREQTIDVISQVQQAYWELVYALRDEQNKLETVNLAREQLRLIEERIGTGLGAPLERAEAETQIETANTNLLASTQYITVTENALKQLLLPNTSSVEWWQPIAPTDQPTLDFASVDLPSALIEARKNRPELTLLATQLDINDLDVKFYRDQTRPRADLQATVSATGLAGRTVNPNGALANGAIITSASGLAVGAGSIQLPVPVSLNELTLPGVGLNPGVVNLPGGSIVTTPSFAPLTVTGGGPNASSAAINPTPGTITPPTFTVPSSVVGGFSQQLRNLLSFNTRVVVVGVTIELPLRNKAARANLAGAKIQREQITALVADAEAAIEADVRNAAQTVETTSRQVVSARAAHQSAEVQLAGERKLYQTGLSTTFLVFQRENQLASARDTELRAETDYNKALAMLQRATSTTLRANNVTIQNPAGP
jgi:HAE1 family hydrophobic/amphiphilic exporter-1